MLIPDSKDTQKQKFDGETFEGFALELLPGRQYRPAPYRFPLIIYSLTVSASSKSSWAGGI